jgi:hypothetical protein
MSVFAVVFWLAIFIIVVLGLAFSAGFKWDKFDGVSLLGAFAA